MSEIHPRWNPKRLGVVKSPAGSHETDVWCYLEGRRLTIVIQVNEGGLAKGTTTYRVLVPR